MKSMNFELPKNLFIEKITVPNKNIKKMERLKLQKVNDQI